jgi:S-adenosylmethionine:tRNA ribosyltransferase-isomerase
MVPIHPIATFFPQLALESRVPLSNYDYDLPRSFIAQEGVEPRDSAKLLVLPREDAAQHRTVSDLPALLGRGDVLVLNESRVLPARVKCRKSTGGKAELLFLGPGEGEEAECLVGGKGLREGSTVVVGVGADAFETELVRSLGEGKFRVRLPEGTTAMSVMGRWGEMPTPPYIRNRLKDQARYQTTFARVDGSVAAPTAGLHFTPRLFDGLAGAGVSVVRLVLHVGLGTFKPVRAEREQDHVMDSEWVSVPEAAADALNEAVEGGRRVYAVGTTTVRSLETATGQDGRVRPFEGATDLFIYPPYRFKFPYSGMLTNFHLPRSTLLMLVSAYAGRERILRAYEEAKAAGYRFYSLGDAMLIQGGPVG